MRIQIWATFWAPTQPLDEPVVRHIERWACPSKEMTKVVTPLFVSACLYLSCMSAIAGSLDREAHGAGGEPQPKLLERTERRSKPVDIFAAPSAAAEWVKARSTHRVELSVRIAR